MSTLERFGALPALGELWNQPAFVVFLFVYFIDFGVISALMGYEQMNNMPHKARHQFRSFIINDTVVLTTYLAYAAYVQHREVPSPDQWYTQTWWHLLALALGYILSISLEVRDVRQGNFTISQELSPSKLYHTFIFGIMGYWLITGTVAAYANGELMDWLNLSVWMLVWVYVLYIDGKHGPRQNAHCEYSWLDMKPSAWRDD